MKAIICDKCGKVILLSDDPMCCADGINKLYVTSKKLDIDLCDECMDELVAAVRKGQEPERI